jgi:hypothetical protein
MSLYSRPLPPGFIAPCLPTNASAPPSGKLWLHENTPSRTPSRCHCPGRAHPCGVKGGLIGFYREIAGVGLMFPRADWPVAVEYPGYPVVRPRRIEGLEFVEETVTALGYSTELAGHLFRECWAVGICGGSQSQ